MKKNKKLCVFFLCSALVSGCLPVYGIQDIQDAKAITIFHTNDMHGALAASSSSIGIDRAAALKEQTPNSILVDAGDAAQGLPLASLTKGADVFRLMNIAKYDVMAPGNHEFDYGTGQLLDNASLAAFPILAANISQSGSPLLAGYPQGNTGCHAIIERDGVKVGFFGLTTAQTVSETNPAGIKDVTFSDEIAAAKKEIDALEGQGAQIIAAVCHLGEYDTVPCTSRQLADAMSGEYQGKLDVIIDGHSHTVENLEENGVVIAQTGSGLNSLGKIVVTLPGEEDSSPAGNPSPTVTAELLSYQDMQAVAPDESVTEAINSITSSQEELLSQEICPVAHTFWGGYVNDIAVPRLTETNLGNLTADAYRYAAEDFLKTAKGMEAYQSLPVVAAENGGGIRESFANGTLTLGGLVSVFPFSNTLKMKVISPRILYEVMEHSLSSITGQDPETGMLQGAPFGGFLQIGGFKIQYRPSGTPKVESITLEGSDTPLDPTDDASQLVLVSNNYIMEGGNDYAMLGDLPLLGEIGGELETVQSCLESLTQNGSIPLDAENTQNRIAIDGGYTGESYTASIRVQKEDQTAAANCAVTVYIDSQAPQTLSTDGEGIVKVTVAPGPHSIRLGEEQPQVYINNYTGAGILEDESQSYPTIAYREPAQIPGTISFTMPSKAETVIAPGRNFYVKGTFQDTEVPENSRLTVTLKNEAGDLVRDISTGIKDNKSLYAPMVTFSTDEAKIPDSGMPDLIWDGSDKASVKNGDSKCYYNDTGFAAMIPGGKTETSIDDGLNLADSAGNPYASLSQGAYTVCAALAAPDGQLLAEAQMSLAIGHTQDKILSRFSPDTHADRISQFAAENGYRIYNDYFPGYWSMDNGFFCENAPQWRAADATEYTEGNVHFIIYNVKSSSTTYGVELGLLQKMGDIDSRLTSYYYSTGEPEPLGDTESQILPFGSGDKLQFVRAELTEEEQKDGIFEEDRPQDPEYDMDVLGGVQAKAGETLSLYGVTAPIQLEQKDVQENQDNTYTLHNKIQTLQYQISGNDFSETFSKEVTLDRVSQGYDNYSELEFKHTIPLSEDMAGKTLTIAVQGYDSRQNPVEGTAESFQLNVKSEEGANQPTPTPTPAVTPTATPAVTPAATPAARPTSAPGSGNTPTTAAPKATAATTAPARSTAAAVTASQKPVKTGDESPILAYAALLAIAGLIISKRLKRQS